MREGPALRLARRPVCVRPPQRPPARARPG